MVLNYFMVRWHFENYRNFWNISRGLYVDFDSEKVACGLYKERLIRRRMNIEQNTMHKLHNQANELLTIHHQTSPSRLDHGQPTQCVSFVKSMYLHMSHISSFLNNYASKLKLKDITLYSRSHEQELLTKTFEREFPRMCNVHVHVHVHVHYNWHMHVFTYVRDRRAVSCRLCVQCMQRARGSWLFRIQYHVTFPHIVIG